MNAEQLAKILQDLLVDRMQVWNETHQDVDPLRKMPWDRLDSLSRVLYVERAQEFLDKYEVEPK